MHRAGDAAPDGRNAPHLLLLGIVLFLGGAAAVAWTLPWASSLPALTPFVRRAQFRDPDPVDNLSPMSGGIRVAFHGVRGSTPCEGRQYERYGGHSSCVALEVDGLPPIVFDLGTGLRAYGERLGGVREFRGTALLTHLHWDHVQGLPFFTPLHHAASTLDVYGPRQAEGPLGDVFAQLMRPPFFPITPAGLTGDVRFHDTDDDDFPVGLAKIRSRNVRHVGPTLGYRVDWQGVSVAYVPDHGPGCCPDDPDDFVPHEVLELCDGVDLLIHDAQHTAEEYGPKRHWGHCTVDYALHVARESGAHSLALFHHDPSHSDDDLDAIAVRAGDDSAARGGPDVFCAREGLEIELRPAGNATLR